MSSVRIREQQVTSRAVYGQSLRLLLVQILIDAGGATLTIPELIARCEAEGVVFEVRASKLVSDTLRWEARKRRVVRVGRGRYRFGQAPRSTRWWIRQKIHVLRTHLKQLRRQARDLDVRVGFERPASSASNGLPELPSPMAPI